MDDDLYDRSKREDAEEEEIDTQEDTQDDIMNMRLPGSYPEQVLANSQLDAYVLSEIDNRVYIAHTEEKGRCLFSRHVVVPGDVVFIEAPIVTVYSDLNKELYSLLEEVNNRYIREGKQLELPMTWHFAAIYSLATLSESDINRIRDKYHPETPEEPSQEILDVLDAVRHYPSKRLMRTTAKEYEDLLWSWRYNCFGHHERDDGLVIYDRVSMLAHSCDSSATWHYSPDQNFVLRARKLIGKDEEITISYIGDEEIYKTCDMRRERLSSWMFVCHCTKCCEEVDKARGLRCPYCGCGCIYLRTEDDESTSAASCTRCDSVLTVDQLLQFLNYEYAYNQRIDAISPEDIDDAEGVLTEAQRVMTQHYLIYDLHTKLYNAYKQKHMYEAAIYNLEKRVQFVNQSSQPASFTVAWLYEELGDLLIHKFIQDNALDNITWPSNVEVPLPLSLPLRNRLCRLYEEAMNVLLASCGDNHAYTLAAHWKMEYINSQQAKLE